jgi:hypothetical protein
MSNVNDELSPPIRAFINRITDEATPIVAASTVALYGVQNDEPVQNGSGVLLRIADAGLLISAAHVLDYATIHKFPHLIGTTGGADLIPLERVEVLASGMPASGDRDDDPFDIGVVRLQPEVVERLEQHKRFLRLHQIDPLVGQDRGNYYFVYGFPFALAKNDPERHIARVTSLRYGTVAHHDARVDVSGFDPDRDLVLSQPPNGNIDSEGNAVELPRLKGISGCGLWRLSRPEVQPQRWTTDSVQLVGIEHTVLRNQYIRGTRIAIVNRLIWDSYPDLRPAMQVGFTAIE